MAAVIPQGAIVLLILCLLLNVFGYMILFSRDITVNIYMEHIRTKNILLEAFQIFFMFVNIIMILAVGYL